MSWPVSRQRFDHDRSKIRFQSASCAGTAQTVMASIDMNRWRGCRTISPERSDRVGESLVTAINAL